LHHEVAALHRMQHKGAAIMQRGNQRNQGGRVPAAWSRLLQVRKLDRKIDRCKVSPHPPAPL
jgi:hypothetical protein